MAVTQRRARGRGARGSFGEGEELDGAEGVEQRRQGGLAAVGAVERQREAEIGAEVDGILARMPDLEREVLIRAWLLDQDIKVVAQHLGLSKSWASRIHKRALGMARDIAMGLQVGG